MDGVERACMTVGIQGNAAPAGFLWLALLVTLSGLGGCTRECRIDADCPVESGLLRCDADGMCAPLPPLDVASCDNDEDCIAGRSCVEKSCVFAPPCQSFERSAALRVVSRCSASWVATSAGLETVACVAELTLGLDGTDAGPATSFVFEPIPATPSEAPLALSDASPVSCAEVRYAPAYTAFLLRDCEMGTERCDVGIVRDDIGTPCFAATDCATGEACEGPLVTAGSLTMGICR